MHPRIKSVITTGAARAGMHALLEKTNKTLTDPPATRSCMHPTGPYVFTNPLAGVTTGTCDSVRARVTVSARVHRLRPRIAPESRCIQ